MPLLSRRKLSDRVKNVREKYKKNNPERVELIDTLDAFTVALEKIDASAEKSDEIELQEIVFGAWVYCFENIANQYWLLNPEYEEGYIFNSGSTCYKILLEELEITPTNNIDEFDALRYMSKFFNYTFKHPKLFTEYFQEKKLNIENIEDKVKTTIQGVFRHVSGEVENMLKAIPTEKSINGKLATLAKDYKNKTKEKGKDTDAERLLLAELGVALSQIIPIERPDDGHFLSRSQRIKIGALLHIMQSIQNEPQYYWLGRSPRHHSELYDLCCDALNINDISDIDPETRRACLSAYETCLLQTDYQKFEDSLKKQKSAVKYSDEKLIQIREEVGVMRKSYSSKPAPILPGVIGAAAVGALICAAPGYGTGYAIGEAIGMTDFVINPKNQFSKALTGKVLHVILGDGGRYLAYYGADKVVNATLERAFAKVFESLGMLVGAAAGGVIGLVVVDLSYKTLSNLCALVLHLRSKLDTKFAQEINPKIFECLMLMPPEVFASEKKEKLQSITKGTFFDRHPAKSDEVDALMREFEEEINGQGNKKDPDPELREQLISSHHRLTRSVGQE